MIRKSLVWKMALAFLLVAITTTALVAISIRITTTDRLNQLIIDQQISGVQEELIAYYTVNGSWDNVESLLREYQVNSPDSGIGMGQGGRNSHGNFRDRRSFFGLADAQGIVLVAVDDNYPPGTALPQSELAQGTPLTLAGDLIGTILVTDQFPGLNAEESLYLERTNQALILASLGALLVAGFMGVFLARSLTRPLKALTGAAQKIADGHLEQQVEVRSKDEIGQLATTFNRMSQEVARANQQRRQMTADIAHDLRTPLTVIGGYVEAMRDEVLSPTPERLDLIYQEIERLQSMVGDLRMLSQADAGELSLNLQPTDVLNLLNRAAGLFQHQAEQHSLTLQVPQGDHIETQQNPLARIHIDEARMMQVLDNLISNAFRYTPAGGKIILCAEPGQIRNKVRFCVRDTGSGIPAEELDAIFERFYRADRSRHSENGESGLGLAIVKALVEAQGGRVWVESKVGEGTAFFMEFEGLAT